MMKMKFGVRSVTPINKKRPDAWAPYCPSALQPADISLWCCGTTTFDTVQVEDIYAKDEKVLAIMW